MGDIGNDAAKWSPGQERRRGPAGLFHFSSPRAYACGVAAPVAIRVGGVNSGSLGNLLVSTGVLFYRSSYTALPCFQEKPFI